MEEKLPIGSVISLKDSKEMKIIIGYNFMKEEGSGIFDYASFPYPIGFIGADTNMTLFNDENIDLLYHKGFESENLEKYFDIIESEFEKEEETKVESKEEEEEEFFEL